MSESLNHFVSSALHEFEDGDVMGPTGEEPGQRLGHYTLMECLGQGGFGAVWKASQTAPVKREVALKIIKLGMDTREVTARFEQERQALAVMDHPGIARIFDAGVTPSFRPYFVMELVRGAPIHRYCDRHSLPLAERLRLFIDVCQAVQHAHQKGVIHRDLKPSNILVSEGDSQPMPKVIDFGIAKATGGERLIDQTQVTRVDRLMGTPAYMSPEQSQPASDVDTRADIYSLGVVLYELIIGRVPFDPSQDSGTRETKRPSTDLRSCNKEELSRIAQARQTEVPRLLHQVKGDLDWIVVKALEPDRERRYDSADAFAEDLQAYLEKRPVTARAPTAWYLTRRFAQRHRTATIAAVMVLLALIAGVTVSTVMYLRAQSELERSHQIVGFLKDTLSQARASKTMGRDPTMMKEILDKTASRLSTELSNRPEVEAELRSIIGQTYLDLGDYKVALEHSTVALAKLRGISPRARPALADALYQHAYHLHEAGFPKEAELEMREALAMQRQLHGDNDSRTMQARIELAWILMRHGRAREGEADAQLATEAWRRNPTDPLLDNAINTLAAIMHHLKRHEESLSLVKEELAALQAQHGPEHPDIIVTQQNLGMQYCRMERFAEAEPHFQEARRQSKLFYKDRQPDIWYTLRGLQRVEGGRQNWDAQLAYAREAMSEVKKFYAPGHQHFQWTAEDLLGVLLTRAERAIKTSPVQSLTILDEIAASADLQTSTKPHLAWINALRGAAMWHEPAQQKAGEEMLKQALADLKAKAKPNAEDQRRIKVIESQWMPPVTQAPGQVLP